MIGADALAPFGPSATACLLPHVTVDPDGLRTLGGRRIPVDASATSLAADLVAETVLARLPLDDPATAAALAGLRAQGIVAILPAETASAGGPVETVVLSPHVDDAALSVGARLASLRGHGGRQLVCNIFSDQSYQTGLRVPVSALGEIAQAEDRLAGRILGYERRNLGLAGAQDRHGLTLSRTLGWDMGTVSADPAFCREVRKLADRLAALLSEPACGRAMILAPAGIGGHLDHVLVALAVRELLAARVIVPERLAIYEDLPYAAAASGPREVGSARPLPTSRDALTLKLAALAVFRTRLRAPQIALCRARALALGGNGPPVEMTFAAAGRWRLPMDSSRMVGSMTT